MFNFDVHDDIRLTHDAAIEKDEVRYSTPLSRFPHIKIDDFLVL